MIKAKQIATSVAAAFALGYGATASALVTAPGAVAEAMWTQDTFRVCAGNGLISGTGTTAGSCLTAAAPVFGAAGQVLSGNGLVFNGTLGLVGTEQAGATARVNSLSVSNNPPPTGIAATFTVAAATSAAFTPGVPLPAIAPTGQHAGGISASSGFSLSPIGADVLLHSQTQINTYGSDGSATSSQTLNATFNFVTTTAQIFELSWDGTITRRAGLGQFGLPADNQALADNSLSFTLSGLTTGGAVSCSWAPDGQAGGAGCSGVGASAIELSDPFSYQDGASVSALPIDFDFGTVSGYWEAEFTLPAGIYTLTIGGQTQADAKVPPLLPEPQTLALLGIGLLGLGVATRRKRRA